MTVPIQMNPGLVGVQIDPAGFARTVIFLQAASISRRVSMVYRNLPEQLATVRQFCQKVLSRKSLSTGIASTESFLLFEDMLWGVRFSMGCYDVRWQLGKDEVVVFEDNCLIEKLEINDAVVKKAA